MSDSPGTVGPVGAEPARSGRNSLLYLIGALLQGLGLFLVQPFAIHTLHNDGKWQELYLSVSVIQIGVVLASAGLPLAITKAWFDPGGHAKARSISGFLSLTGLLIGVLAAVVYWIWRRNAEGTLSFVVALVAMGLLASVLGAQAILRAQARPGVFVLLSIGSSVVAYGVGLAAMLFFGAEASIFMLGYGVALVLTAVLAVAVTRPSSPFAFPGAAKEALGIGLPVLPHTGALMLLTQGAVFLLAITAPKGISGDYGKVQIFALGTITLLGALNNAWVPALMSVRGKARVQRLRATMTTASWAGLGIVAVASAGANVVTHVMAGGREDLIPVAQILPLLAMGYLLYLNASTLLFADKATWLLAVVTPAVLVVGALMALWPAAAGNLVGMAAASVASFFLLGLAYLAVAFRRGAGGWALRSYAGCCLVAVVYVGILLLLPRGIVTGLLTVVIVGVLLLGVLAVFTRRRRRSPEAAPVLP